MGPNWQPRHSEASVVELNSKGSDPTTIDNSSQGEEIESVLLETTQQYPEERNGTMTTTLPLKLDKYGFIMNMDSRGNLLEEESNGDEFRSKDRVPIFTEAQRTERREKKWKTTLQSWERRRPKQLLRRLRKGLPDSVRGRVWVRLGGGIRTPGLYQEILRKTSDAMLESYKEIAEQKAQGQSESSNPTSPTSSEASSSPAKEETKNSKASSDSEEFAQTRSFRSIQDIIERDIYRTYPKHSLFYEEERPNEVPPEHPLLGGFCDPELAALILSLESDLKISCSGGTLKPVSSLSLNGTKTPGGQAALRRVLRAYSYYDRDVGYCQGMNFIAGMFLTLMSEEEAFWLLVAIMHEKPCEMRGLFGEGMRDAHKVLHVAEKLIHHHLPKLAKHFDKENIHVTMYATQWLLTQYTSSFNFDLVTRVWDCFLGEGWKIIYRVMLALLQQWQSQLLKMSFEEILAFFRELPDRVEGYEVMETAMKIPLRAKHIIKYEKEWETRQAESQ